MAKPYLYPLKFQEIYKEKPWGGRRLESVVGKQLPAGKAIGESWEISDHPHGQSRVKTGPLANKTIQELIAEYGAEFAGKSLITRNEPYRFQLLIKFLDIGDAISLQVHPDREAAKQFNEESAKNEAWYVISADEGAGLVCGLAHNAKKEDLKSILNPDNKISESARAEQLRRLLNFIPVRKGDVINLPAGTVHSASGGIVLAEIQQNSDVTYRMYDWGRTEPDETPRPLHLDKAFASIRENPAAGCVQIQRITSHPYDRYHLIENEQFIIEMVETSEFASEIKEQLTGDRFHILMVVSGMGELEFSPSPGSSRCLYSPFVQGETILIPASIGDYTIRGYSIRILKIIPALTKDKKG